MTDILLAFGGLMLVFLAILGLRILIERKYPTYIKESLKGRLPDDCTVCALIGLALALLAAALTASRVSARWYWWKVRRRFSPSFR